MRTDHRRRRFRIVAVLAATLALAIGSGCGRKLTGTEPEVLEQVRTMATGIYMDNVANLAFVALFGFTPEGVLPERLTCAMVSERHRADPTDETWINLARMLDEVRTTVRTELTAVRIVSIDRDTGKVTGAAELSILDTKDGSTHPMPIGYTVEKTADGQPYFTVWQEK